MIKLNSKKALEKDNKDSIKHWTSIEYDFKLSFLMVIF
jgi:hypothetical protein